MKTLYLGNNEQVSSGVFPNNDGTFTAMTFTKSKDFKTEAGANRWYAKNTGAQPVTIPTFNAANLRKLTDASRQPAEVEHANRMFKELQLRAWTQASIGKTTAGLSPNEVRPLGKHGVMVLRELAEAAELTFFVKDNIHVWVKW